MDRLNNKQVAAIRRALVEFGYPDLTLAEVREQADRVVTGEDLGDDVIGMLIKSFLVGAGLMP